ncbi:MAG: PLP-dependent aminotransferase family protein [Lachnospiraceae bacterium]|nr:PLP-dependent aminotransferase family protein [Lachnospiraceae bacterium]
MPVNSFENYPMSWKPNKTKLERPYYLSIATMLEQDIINGSLPANTKLPPQRELADFLDLNLSTITRAYKICELKGLLYAVTGRGTFVSPGTFHKDTFIEESNHLIEMGMIKPFYETNSLILEVSKSIMENSNSTKLFEYSSPLGTDKQLHAAVQWLKRYKINVSESNTMIVAGAQNALGVILISLFKAGDKIVVDEFTYANFRGLANLLHIQLITIEADRYGMIPEALLTTCKNSDIRGIYLMPTCSNPTSIFMPQKRREELVNIIQQYNLLLIEDDTYSFLAPANVKPFFSMIPDYTLHICSLSKSLCPGLRVAFLAFPKQFSELLISGMLNLNLKTVSLNAEIIAELIENGHADKIVNEKINLAQERNQIYKNFFPIDDESIARFFHWLKLPANLASEEAEVLALHKGIHILGSHRFAMGSQNKSSYIRLSIASPSSKTDLTYALQTLNQIFDGQKYNLFED